MPTIVTGGNNSAENLNPTEHQDNNAQSQNVNTENVQPVKQIATPTIINNTVPVVVFVGPPASGKSMILVRLSKYLRSQGYTIKTDPTFLNTEAYQRDCQEFQNSLNTVVALRGTVKFLLVNIYKDGKEIAKLLEAPGEDFYTPDPQKIAQGENDSIKPYLATIMTSTNPKSYVMLLDLDSEISFRRDAYHRDSYSQRFLTHFYPAINHKRDRIILLYNKIDVTMFGNINGCTNIQLARQDAELHYKQLFASMKVSKLGGFITGDNFAFKTFCTGMFSKQTDNLGNDYYTYNVADDIYPQELWNEIIKKW